jgi:hypothetical protein
MSIFSRDITVFFARMPCGQQPHTLLTRPHTTSFFFSISESKNCPHTKIYKHCMCQEEYMSNGWIKCSSFGFLVQHLDRYKKYVPVIGDYFEVTQVFFLFHMHLSWNYIARPWTHTHLCVHGHAHLLSSQKLLLTLKPDFTNMKIRLLLPCFDTKCPKWTFQGLFMQLM